MDSLLLPVLDALFIVFHTGLVLFNVLGWAIRRLRRWHLLSLALTASSWLVMGIWKGVGYCVCTDWHWQVREALGNAPQHDNYVQFLTHQTTGWNPSPQLTASASASAFLASLLISVWLNFRPRSAQTTLLTTPRAAEAPPSTKSR